MSGKLSDRFEKEVLAIHDFTKDLVEKEKKILGLEGKLSDEDSVKFQEMIIEKSKAHFNIDSNYKKRLASLTGDMVPSLDETANSFTENFIDEVKREFRSVEGKELGVNRYVFVAVKEKNPKKNNRFDRLVLEQWYDGFNNSFPFLESKFHIDNSKKFVNSIANLLAFPVRMKLTKVEEYQSESTIRSNVINKPAEYLPQVVDVNSVSDLSELNKKILKSDDYIFLTLSNYVQFVYPEGSNFRPISGFYSRVKLSEGDSIKWGKFAAGVTKSIHSDSVGVMIQSNYEDTPFLFEILQRLSSDGKDVFKANTDSRYPLFTQGYELNAFELEDVFKDEVDNKKLKNALKEFVKEPKYNFDEYKEIIRGAKKTFFDLLNRADEIKESLSYKHYDLLVKPYLVFGEWVDLREKSTGKIMEVQIKTQTAFSLYSWNSIAGHNSHFYNGFRNEYLWEKLKTKDADLITKFYANLFAEAFLMSNKKGQFTLEYSR